MLTQPVERSSDGIPRLLRNACAVTTKPIVNLLKMDEANPSQLGAVPQADLVEAA